ncbi:hypothetical protein BGX33_000919 [Mortierella sp. NVP41]|nr:hypothetical protein BGX33_000919 [Mortierella sp. NVP41]
MSCGATVKDEAGFYIPLYYPDLVHIANATEALSRNLTGTKADTIVKSSFFLLLQVTQMSSERHTHSIRLSSLQFLSRHMIAYRLVYKYHISRREDMHVVQD